MNGRQRAIMYCLMTIAAGSYGVTTLVLDMPNHGETRMWSAWLVLMYLSLVTTTFGAIRLVQIVAPPDEEDMEL